MIGDDDAAAPGGLGGVDAVFDAETGGVTGGAESLGRRIGADTANEEDRGGREEVLSLFVIIG